MGWELKVRLQGVRREWGQGVCGGSGGPGECDLLEFGVCPPRKNW